MKSVRSALIRNRNTVMSCSPSIQLNLLEGMQGTGGSETLIIDGNYMLRITIRG